jgi:hypothetical protein
MKQYVNKKIIKADFIQSGEYLINLTDPNKL